MNNKLSCNVVHPRTCNSKKAVYMKKANHYTRLLLAIISLVRGLTLHLPLNDRQGIEPNYNLNPCIILTNQQKRSPFGIFPYPKNGVMNINEYLFFRLA